MSKWLLAGAIVLLCGGALARAAEVVRGIDWATERHPGFEVLPPMPETNGARARVTNMATEPLDIKLLTLNKPGVGQATYAITGQARALNVQGGAYLEMWSHLPDGGRYFTRTLAAKGPMAQLHGTSEWRSFVLPFHLTNATTFPTMITLHVVLPSRGTVELGPLELVQYGPGEDPLAQSGRRGPGWLGGLVGGLLGSLLGLLGAAIGVLSATGRHRRLVMGLLWAGIICGLTTLAGGLVAIVVWPGVSAVLILAGSLAALIFMPLRAVVRRRYDEAELRRMQALDAT